jgi:hypothetical protein
MFSVVQVLFALIAPLRVNASQEVYLDMTAWNRLKLDDTHFYLDEFACGRNHPPRLPDGCPYCGGSVVLYPWLLRPLERVRNKFADPDVPFRIKSGHRCRNYNRDIYALVLFEKLFAQLNPAERAEVMGHDTSRHLLDAVDIEPVTDDKGVIESVYEELEQEFAKHGYTYRGAGFIHCDVRNITRKRLGV